MMYKPQLLLALVHEEVKSYAGKWKDPLVLYFEKQSIMVTINKVK